MTLASSFAIHFTLILFGAPLTRYSRNKNVGDHISFSVYSHVFQTYLLAFLVSILTVFTPAYILGPPSFTSDTESLVIRLTWIRLFTEFW